MNKKIKVLIVCGLLIFISSIMLYQLTSEEKEYLVRDDIVLYPDTIECWSKANDDIWNSENGGVLATPHGDIIKVTINI